MSSVARPASVALAASFVVTVGSCGGAGFGGRDESPASLSRRDDGTCHYAPKSSCPRGASCNPPAPKPAECPPEGATKVRILERLDAYRGACTFVSDGFCTMPPGDGCDERPNRELSCRELLPNTSGRSVHHVDAFVAKRADGGCTRFPAFTCTPGCSLPEGEAVSCDVPAAPPTFETNGDAPTPFTAAQIAEATRNGRTYVWRVELADGETTQRVIRFEDVDDEGANLRGAADVAGLQSAEPKRVTWEELRKHASFAAAATSIQRKTVTVPAGTFDCEVYTVVADEGVVRQFYFATALPGAPVLHIEEKLGKRISTNTLMTHDPGGDVGAP